jgi:hypothetical protein
MVMELKTKTIEELAQLYANCERQKDQWEAIGSLEAAQFIAAADNLLKEVDAELKLRPFAAFKKFEAKSRKILSTVKRKPVLKPLIIFERTTHGITARGHFTWGGIQYTGWFDEWTTLVGSEMSLKVTPSTMKKSAEYLLIPEREELIRSGKVKLSEDGTRYIVQENLTFDNDNQAAGVIFGDNITAVAQWRHDGKTLSQIREEGIHN